MWDNISNSFDFNQGVNLETGLEFTIGDTSVLSATTVLGKTIETDFSSKDDSKIPTVKAVTDYVANAVTAATFFASAI